MEKTSSFYTTVPGYVRFDDRISRGCAFMYGDIAALCDATGECWATNAYLAKINGVDKKTISKWVSELESCGHIKTRLEHNETGECVARFIKTGIPMPFPAPTPIQSMTENNSTSQNSTVYTTIVQPVAQKIDRGMPVAKEPVSEKVDWSAAKSDLQKFMGAYIKLQLPEIYLKADKVQVAGFFKQYGKMFSTMLATAGGLDMAMIALDEAKKYYKHLGFPWGLKALYGKWSDFVNESNEVMRRRNAQIK